MSFCERCKEEIMAKDLGRGEGIAMLSAILKQSGSISIDKTGTSLSVDTESLEGIKTVWAVLQKVYNIAAEIDVNKPSTLFKNRSYSIKIIPKNVARVLQDCSIAGFDGNNLSSIYLGLTGLGREEEFFSAYIRGLFLNGGTVCAPENEEKHNGYHLEIPFSDIDFAEEVVKKTEEYGITFKTIARGEGVGLYIKDSNIISDFMAMIGASESVLELNCIIVDRSLRNNINRQNNCVIANIDKTVEAGYKQASAIKVIQSTVGLSALSDKLREIATIRLNNPDFSLEQIAEELSSPISKSGINHRFRRIMELANELQKEGENE